MISAPGVTDFRSASSISVLRLGDGRRMGSNYEVRKKFFTDIVNDWR